MIDILKSSELIFHYTKIHTAFEFILHDNHLRFSRLQDTNDPYEYNPLYYTSGGWYDGKKESLTSKLAKADSFLNDVIKKKCRIACFCSNHPVDFGYYRSRMWSQHGENHRGVCLVFDKNLLNQSIRNLQNSRTFIVQSEKVDYTDTYGINSEATYLDHSSLPNPNIAEYLNNYGKDVFFTKHRDYRDESEYRIMVYDPMDLFTGIEIRTSLIGIIVGDRFPKSYEPVLKHFSERYEKPYGQIFWQNGMPAYSPKSVN